MKQILLIFVILLFSCEVNNRNPNKYVGYKVIDKYQVNEFHDVYILEDTITHKRMSININGNNYNLYNIGEVIK